MHIAEFLDPFSVAPNVEVVEALLPDVLRGVIKGGLNRIAASLG